MTIEELYGKVLADEGLKVQLAEAAKAGKLSEWMAKQGVDATEEELLAYARALVEDGKELSEDELEKVAGGTGYFEGVLSVVIMEPACFEDD